ncbi:unnamed protein product [Candida verbasci]|uniref:Uncharacterized protein n=1 Tax=Candida verbasci TaxID=1227364 RepID=A0A9W4U0A2_9ASCO|nr:unnamed protein product [Candida verbasci]
MKFSSIIAVGSALISTAFAQDVGCFVNGNQVAVVDLDTGSCPFTIPANLPVPTFRFVDENDYTVQFYYSVFDAIRYFTDIVNAGNVISIPANLLYNGPALPLFSVAAEETPASNSTAALRKRFLKDTPLIKRETVDEFVAGLRELNGTLIDSGSTFEVRDPIVSASPSVSASPTLTIQTTTITTVTTCSTGTGLATITAVPSVVTTTVSGVETVYTTWCPITTDSEGHTYTLAPEHGQGEVTSKGGAGPATVTEQETTIITITSCHEDKCHQTTVPATKSLGTTTVRGVETVYTTWCPVTTTEGEEKPVSTPAASKPASSAPAASSAPVAEQVTTVTVTKPVSTSVHSQGTEASTSIFYTTVTSIVSAASAPGASAPAGSAPGASAPTVAAQSGTPVTQSSVPQPTVAAQSQPPASAVPSTAAISTYEGNAAKYGASFLAVALIPLALI